MKQLLANALLSFVTGVCFCLGIVLIGNLFYPEGNYNERVYVDEPEGFILNAHKIQNGEVNFTIKGKIENTTEIGWSTVTILTKIYAGSAYMTSCRDSVKRIESKEIRNFTIVCHETTGTNLPQNINYKLSVIRGSRN